ncbi:hypothetical protein [Streptomyces jeddahensis]|uniref:PE-PGRS family protein n=1 Tax=Streptomyces jeddahensis TaxID=1716141 RepID=A0A177HNM3_9ACTN|nr:hypothetical protein [Streptomyces jeddahensis]OAH12483.1 hypothetical protein STSP_41610 [Streptomyces jeddahensis]
MTAGWCARTVRAAMFAAVCVLLAALGHVMMSGNPVPAWAMAVGVAATGALGWCLAGRERGLSLTVSVVVAAQTALHWAFSLAQSAAAGTASGSASGDMASMRVGSMHMGSMRHDMGPETMGMGAMATTMDMGSMPRDSMGLGHMGVGHMGVGHMDHAGAATGGGSSSFGMLAAHLLAALLCGLWLAYGERAAFRILRAVAGWLAAPLRLLLALPVPPHRPRLHVRRRRTERSLGQLLLVHAITSRGPPPGTAVA